MKLLFRLCGGLLLLAWLPVASGQLSPPKVAKVELKHVGPATANDELIRANIRVKPGDPYRTAAVDDDVRELYATDLFSDIRVTDETSPDGVLLTYIVVEK